jgi:hypothetical protein
MFNINLMNGQVTSQSSIMRKQESLGVDIVIENLALQNFPK